MGSGGVRWLQVESGWVRSAQVGSGGLKRGKDGLEGSGDATVLTVRTCGNQEDDGEEEDDDMSVKSSSE